MDFPTFDFPLRRFLNIVFYTVWGRRAEMSSDEVQYAVPRYCNYFPGCGVWTWSGNPRGYYKTDFYLCSVTLFILRYDAGSSPWCVTPTLRSLTLVKKCHLPQSSLQKASLPPIRVSQGASWPHCSNLTMLAAHITAGGVGSKPHTNFPSSSFGNLELLPSVDRYPLWTWTRENSL